MKNQNSEQSTVDSHLEVEDHIQSMLNGELGPQARRKLLINIDSNHPDYWRYVALGFVEQQILSQTLASDDTVLSHEPLDQLTRKPSYSARQWALAACLTFSLLAAAWWLGSQSGFKTAAGEALAATTITEPASPGSLNEPSASISKDQSFAMDVPVYDATKNETVALTQLNASANSLRKAQDMLHQRGYDTSTNTQFLTADLQDGRQLVVPINHIVFQQTPESTNSQQPEL